MNPTSRPIDPIARITMRIGDRKDDDSVVLGPIDQEKRKASDNYFARFSSAR
jgi:hypothetical protein